MNKLEQKIKANKATMEANFTPKNTIVTNSTSSQTKSSFNDGWDKGWNNTGKRISH